MGASDRSRGHGDGLGRQPEPQPGLSHLGVLAQGKRNRQGDLQVLAAVASGPGVELKPSLETLISFSPAVRHFSCRYRTACGLGSIGRTAGEDGAFASRFICLVAGFSAPSVGRSIGRWANRLVGRYVFDWLVCRSAGKSVGGVVFPRLAA